MPSETGKHAMNKTLLIVIGILLPPFGCLFAQGASL